ncbi:dihydropteroate synthase [Hydrangea phyllody phytoplasma]|uniref:dihydropteroate synthase n=2 Tax=16SrI (Aster yellows group) TaxID=3042590 RepID=A0ABQ5PT37_9MOLU|nr:dihydropteroate synthase [Hydrangea phyllody phytoplasma]GFZ75481.1 dihydropteroate synthase [Hydrangea phyllody phytoplasma]GLH61529.1 dihydropteroate synthase [Rhus yellows phytoplasma]GLH62130.1 dihydropteroate synthase [Hydrangea phyllody phytoplasma]
MMGLKNQTINFYYKHPKIWKLAHNRQIEISHKALIMAIINVTPDSFSDGNQHFTNQKAVNHALRCLKEGADIIDIGGESTRPGAIPITPLEEQKRILPVIKELSRHPKAIISVDTYHFQTAKLAIKAGAHIINDVCGLQQNPQMAQTIASLNAGVCIMHTGRNRKKLSNALQDQFYFLNHSLEIAKQAQIATEAIVIDPGFGFEKNIDENFDIIKEFEQLTKMELPILVGLSRKRFLKAIIPTESLLQVESLDAITATANFLLRTKGASIFRVHNVKMNKNSLLLADTLMKKI